MIDGSNLRVMSFDQVNSEKIYFFFFSSLDIPKLQNLIEKYKISDGNLRVNYGKRLTLCLIKSDENYHTVVFTLSNLI